MNSDRFQNFLWRTDNKKIIILIERSIMKRNIKIFSVLLILMVCLTSCGDTWIKPKITSSIDEYSTTMSSVPGFPISVGVTFDGPSASITSIVLITNKGSFVQWGDDNKVTNLGKEAKFAGKKIYWTPFEEGNEIADGAKIIAIVSYIDKIVEVAKTTSRRIYKNNEGMYTFR